MTTTGKGPLWRHPFQASRLDWNSSSIWFYRIGQALLLLGTTLVAVVLARLILRG